MLAATFGLAETPIDLRPRYNAAPTDPLPTIGVRRPTVEEPAPGRTLRLMRWGLVPPWADDETVGARHINARAESIDVRPAFADSLRKRRCLVPADGFFEWHDKQPYLIRRVDQLPFAMAGIWASWRPPGDRPGSKRPRARHLAGEPGPPSEPDTQTSLGLSFATESPSPVTTTATVASLRSFAIVTVAANATLSPLHDRMPAVLPPSAWEAWLDPDLDEPEALLPLLRPAPAELLIAVRVGPRVGNVRHDDPSCIAPFELAATSRPLPDPTATTSQQLFSNERQ